MKKIGIIFGAIFCIFAAYGVTETITWHVDNTTSTTTCESGGDIILPTAPTKYGYAFLGWAYYIPIEYLESTGTQYIDTGFKPNQDTRIVMEYMISSCDVSPGFLFGARSYGGATDVLGILYDGASMFSFDRYSRIQCTNITSAFYNNKLNLNMATVNTVTVTNTTTETQLVNCTNNTGNNPQSNYSLYLFGINNGGNTQLCNCPLKVYSFQIYDNGTLVRDMIPVLDPYDVPCMYDRVSDQFFYNAGTGNFIAGPVISE